MKKKKSLLKKVRETVKEKPVEEKPVPKQKLYKLTCDVTKQYKAGDYVPEHIAQRWIKVFNTDGWFE